MVGHLTPYDPVYREQWAAAAAALRTHTDPYTASLQASGLMYDKLLQQANLWSFVEDFRVFGILCVVCVPLVFLFKKVRAGAGAGAGAH